MQEAWVQFLVGEIRSHKPHSIKKKRRRRRRKDAKWKSTCNLKMLRAIFYLLDIFRTSSLGDSISSNPEKTTPRRWEEEPGYIEVLQQMAGSLHKLCLLIKNFSERYLKIYIMNIQVIDKIKLKISLNPSLLPPVSLRLLNSFSNTHEEHVVTCQFI